MEEGEGEMEEREGEMEEGEGEMELREGEMKGETIREEKGRSFSGLQFEHEDLSVVE